MDYPEEMRKRCFTCGFLGKVVLDTGGSEVLEATYKQRAEGNLYTSTPDIRTVPWCLLGVTSLPDEVKAIAGSEATISDDNLHTLAATKSVITKDRDCAEWYGYFQFVTPKEHLGRRDVDRLEEARRVWQKDSEEDRRQWHAEFEDARQKTSDRRSTRLRPES